MLVTKAFSKYHASFADVVGCHFNDHPVSHYGAYLEATHLACRVGDDPMVIIQANGKTSLGQYLLDLASKLRYSSLANDLRPSAN